MSSSEESVNRVGKRWVEEPHEDIGILLAASPVKDLLSLLDVSDELLLAVRIDGSAWEVPWDVEWEAD